MPELNIPTNNPLEPASDPEPDPICVDVAINHSILVSENRVREIVAQILADHQWQTGEISIAIVNDETIHQMNREFLNHDYETDVLSFVFERDEEKRSLSGEVVVSAETAIALAKGENVDPGDELLLYLIHGVLHLVGFDDKDSHKRKEMRCAEEHYTTMFSIKYSPPAEPEIDGEAN